MNLEAVESERGTEETWRRQVFKFMHSLKKRRSSGNVAEFIETDDIAPIEPKLYASWSCDD